ncbi:hypothetical protein FHS82_000308 [Pseudochelatococcus lubricantis]|uniref:Nucleotide exchange factor GrpE n=1 Tax=Pseudochelatococcus lubricantis TaxID=1538102 RepID=A0ABX0UX83_9HYPH|nr:hypothetical protein [Pseudochelatococcus lubricantis]NIJ56495.1 hypothetical protein [Pseudochelatococcus lubricantis]
MTNTQSGAPGKAGQDDAARRKELEEQEARVDRRLDEELVETFPASDAPSVTQPGAGQETGAEVEKR